MSGHLWAANCGGVDIGGFSLWTSGHWWVPTVEEWTLVGAHCGQVENGTRPLSSRQIKMNLSMHKSLITVFLKHTQMPNYE